MHFNCDILSLRSWSGIVLREPEEVQYDRNKECSCYHQRPSGCWIKMTLAGETGIPCRPIVLPQTVRFPLWVCVSLSYMWIRHILCGTWERDISMCVNCWHHTMHELQDGVKRQAPVFASWTQINNLCVRAECFSRPVCLSLNWAHILLFPFLFSVPHTHFCIVSESAEFIFFNKRRH